MLIDMPICLIFFITRHYAADVTARYFLDAARAHAPVTTRCWPFTYALTYAITITPPCCFHMPPPQIAALLMPLLRCIIVAVYAAITADYAITPARPHIYLLTPLDVERHMIFHASYYYFARCCYAD